MTAGEHQKDLHQRCAQKTNNVHSTGGKSLQGWERSRLKLSFMIGWNTPVNPSSLFLTHCFTSGSTLLCSEKQRSRREGELDKWMGQTHVCIPFTFRAKSSLTTCPLTAPWICKSQMSWPGMSDSIGLLKLADKGIKKQHQKISVSGKNMREIWLL